MGSLHFVGEKTLKIFRSVLMLGEVHTLKEGQ
jgi:hypothetical protein